LQNGLGQFFFGNPLATVARRYPIPSGKKSSIYSKRMLWSAATLSQIFQKYWQPSANITTVHVGTVFCQMVPVVASSHMPEGF
jgi:hypothetical protein